VFFMEAIDSKLRNTQVYPQKPPPMWTNDEKIQVPPQKRPYMWTKGGKT